MINPKNWRRHPRRQADALRGLLAEIGYADALLSRELPDGRLMLIDGHLRARTTPDFMVPVLVLDVSAEEADKLLLTLDPLAALAEADAERIGQLIATVRTENQAVESLLRQTAGERLWQIAHPDEIREAGVATDRAGKHAAKWDVRPGQLWQIGPHRLLCGDCREAENLGRLCKGVGAFRLILTDPWYGVSRAGKNAYLEDSDHGTHIRKRAKNRRLSPNEVKALFQTSLKQALTQALPGAACYAIVPSDDLLPYFIAGFEASGLLFKQLLVWVKQQSVIGQSDYPHRHEAILYGWAENGSHYFTDDRTQDSVFEADRRLVNDLDPTTTTVELLVRMIANSSIPGEIVYDPFCGRGSSILAAHQLGRIGYGCEINPQYVAVTIERLSLMGLRPEVVEE